MWHKHDKANGQKENRRKIRETEVGDRLHVMKANDLPDIQFYIPYKD